MRITASGNETVEETLAEVLSLLDSVEAGLLADMEASLLSGKPLPSDELVRTTEDRPYDGLADWRRAAAETEESPPPPAVSAEPPAGALDSRVPTFEQVQKWGAALLALRAENESLRRDNETLTEIASEAQDPANRPLVTRGGVGGRPALTAWREQTLGGYIVTMRRLRAVGRVSGPEAAARIARTEGVADLAALSVGYPENLARARMLDNARVALTHGPTARLLSNPSPIFDDLRASVTSQAILGAGPPGSRAIFERSAERPEARAAPE